MRAHGLGQGLGHGLGLGRGIEQQGSQASAFDLPGRLYGVRIGLNPPRRATARDIAPAIRQQHDDRRVAAPLHLLCQSQGRVQPAGQRRAAPPGQAGQTAFGPWQ